MKTRKPRPKPTQFRVELQPETMQALKAYAAEHGTYVREIANEVIVSGVAALRERRRRTGESSANP